MLAKVGFAFTPQQLFCLVALPNLVGSLLRLPYTFAVPKFGGRNWTVMSALLLVIPTVLFAIAVQNPGTPFWVFMLIAATAGFGGGNFASSMASINFFYPQAKKGAALGLNAAGGNVGASFIQFFLPIIVGGAGAFGLVKASQSGIVLQRAGYLYAALAVLAAVCAYFFMNNLHAAYSKPREQLAVVKYKHTWVMAFLYIGTFGSFIGYSAAMPLLIKINFFRSPIPTASIGINFAYYAFLGALVGSVARPYGGWLADKYGGARVTMAAFVAMIAGTLGVLYTLTQLDTVPKPDPAKLAAWTADPSSFPGFSPAVVTAVDHNSGLFPWFLACFLFVFAATGIGNGSAYRMIPAIWKTYAKKAGSAGSPARIAARLQGHQGGLRGAGHRERGGRVRRLPDPDHVRVSMGHRPGVGGQDGVHGVHRLLRGLRPGDLGLLPAADLGDGAGTTCDGDRHPLSLLRPAVRHDAGLGWARPTVEPSRDRHRRASGHVVERYGPTNRGGLCQKGWTSADVLTATDRITRPLLRGPSGDLEPVTWHEALGFVADRVREIQAESRPGRGRRLRRRRSDQREGLPARQVRPGRAAYPAHRLQRPLLHVVGGRCGQPRVRRRPRAAVPARRRRRGGGGAAARQQRRRHDAAPGPAPRPRYVATGAWSWSTRGARRPRRSPTTAMASTCSRSPAPTRCCCSGSCTWWWPRTWSTRSTSRPAPPAGTRCPGRRRCGGPTGSRA